MHELPHITVATIVERDGKFLMVRENSGGRLVYNQPAGHVEPSESLFDAALRETLEETAWRVELKQLLGIYQYTSAENGITYIRHCFVAKAIEPRTGRNLDPDILEAKWLTLKELEDFESELRSPLVLKVIRDYLSGVNFPLNVVQLP
ncbi:MAG: NUDIX hydrolase [Gammaproteobacteria bacterium]|jgi:ADP-ribose pyrophosphatase YjhB (NUDIX family)|nr:NUDIX hydrolase [Gammaproteobacteria bacterium]MDG2337274.1 NUDIX hydrolase [Gammaproteobacteria bacterium]